MTRKSANENACQIRSWSKKINILLYWHHRGCRSPSELAIYSIKFKKKFMGWSKCVGPSDCAHHTSDERKVRITTRNRRTTLTRCGETEEAVFSHAQHTPRLAIASKSRSKRNRLTKNDLRVMLNETHWCVRVLLPLAERLAVGSLQTLTLMPNGTAHTQLTSRRWNIRDKTSCARVHLHSYTRNSAWNKTERTRCCPVHTFGWSLTHYISGVCAAAYTLVGFCAQRFLLLQTDYKFFRITEFEIQFIFDQRTVRMYDSFTFHFGIFSNHFPRRRRHQ